jgi:hypothetical protein
MNVTNKIGNSFSCVGAGFIRPAIYRSVKTDTSFGYYISLSACPIYRMKPAKAPNTNKYIPSVR